MTTVTAGTSASVTLGSASTIAIAPDANERCEVVVLRGGTQVYSASIRSPMTIGPFLAADVFTITASRGDADYTVSTYTDPASVSGAGNSTALALPATRSTRLAWAYRSPVTGSGLEGSWAVYAPVTSREYYNYAVYGNKHTTPFSALNYNLIKFGLAIKGYYTRHDAGTGVTKTGASWASVSANFLAFQGEYARMHTAGDKITIAVTGHSVVLRSVGISNGGYAIVSIDGSWTAANCLPTFTADDFTGGRCRSTDVGKRFINFYYAPTCADLHVPLVQGLSDGPHTVVIEATGTKAPGSTDTRAYVAGLVTASVAHVDAVMSGTIAFGHMEPVYNGTDGPGQFAMVFEAEKPTALGTWEFRVGVHGGETDTSFAVFAGSNDVTSSTSVGNYANASTIRVEMASTIANSDAPGTPFATKKQTIYASGLGRVPIAARTLFTITVARRIRSSYPLMMTFSQVKTDTADGYPIQQNMRWDQFAFGDYVSTPEDLSRNDTNYGLNQTEKALVTSTMHPHTAFCALLDGYRSVRDFLGSADLPVFMRSIASGNYEKMYFCRDSTNCANSYAVGEVIESNCGWGVLPGTPA